MIRPTTPDDIPALMAVVQTIGFDPPDLEQLQAMLMAHFEGEPDGFWLTDDNNGPVGVAYCEPERMADQTWNLLLLAVHSDWQEQGRGTALIRHVEQTARARGARMLLVETSGLPSFAGTRTFYHKCGYEEEARIRDFYAAGDDKIVFRKMFQA